MGRLTGIQRTCIAVAVGQCFAGIGHAANIVVDSTTDNGIDCTLREAIESINAGADQTNGCGGTNFGTSDTITFDPELSAISAANIQLTSGEIEITKDVIITGLGQDDLIIDGNFDAANNTGTGRIFNISSGAQVQISSLTLQNGSAGVNGNYGGTIWAHAQNTSLSLSNCTITGSFARSGGGVAIQDNLTAATIDNCNISGNSTTSRGGGITSLANVGSTTELTITNSQISNNTTTGNSRGGGLFLFNTQTTVDSSKIFSNRSPSGGGIRAQSGASAAISNSKIYLNSANVASAIGVDNSTIDINTSSIYQNTQAGAIRLSSNYGPPIVTVTDSTITDNSSSAIQLITDNALFTIERSTVSGHTTSSFGGAAYIRNGTFNAINSTFTNNKTLRQDVGGGGAIAARYESEVNLFNCTLVQNEAGLNGGNLLMADNATLNISNTLVTGGKVIAGSGTEISVSAGVITSKNNLLGNSSQPVSQTFFGFTPDPSDIVAATDGDTPTPEENIITSPAADNGGAGQTFLLADKSPALDAGDNTICGEGLLVDVDQRGQARDDGQCDIGAVEIDQPDENMIVIPLEGKRAVIVPL